MYYEITRLLGYDSYRKAMSFYRRDITKINEEFIEEEKLFKHSFAVDSQSSYRKYNVWIKNNGNQIYGYDCDCPQFKREHTCKHVAAVMYYHLYDITQKKYVDDYILTKEVFKLFDDIKEDKGNIRRKLNVKLEFTIDNNFSFKLKIGEDKLYTLKSNQVRDFLRVIDNGTFEFGKKFTYDSNIHYFDSFGYKIIRYLRNAADNFQDKYYSSINPYNLSRREINYLFELLGNKNIEISKYGKVDNVIYGFPTKFDLNKEDGYKLTIDDYENFNILNSEGDYIIYNNDLYILDKKEADLINVFNSNELKCLKFKEEDVDTFKKKIFSRIKNHINIDEDIKSISLPIKPEAELYFDLSDILKFRLVLNYKGEKIDYLSNDKSDIRDKRFENEIINEITNDGFTLTNEGYIIDNEDEYYYFIEKELAKYVDKYNVFLDKKIKDSQFKKNLSTSNNFSIGRDNILSYKFNIDGVEPNELKNIFKSLKRKKKYYKLKNGDILNLNENEEINELNDLIEDLNLNNEDIESGNAQIPKYRAIYIDSLKNYKYNNIKTNNLFDEFINNFKKYQKLEINFDKKDEEILRDYQKDGVKWLKTIYKCDLGGILADEMGLGKSLQTIMLIKEILKEKEDAKILIVSPTSLVYNWQKEFEKFAPDLNFITLADSKLKRKEIFSKKDKYNIFITSYGLVRNDNDAYEDMEFELCVIDEAQAIKNYKAGMTKEVKKIKSKCKIALTGTPVENNITEIWSIFDFIMPGYLNSIIKFNEKYKVKDVNDEATKVLKELKKQISPFILRRKKCDVAKSLPDKIEKNIYLDLGEEQKKLYAIEVNETKEKMNEMIGRDGFAKSKMEIFKLLTRLRQICIDPNVMYENYNGESAKLEQLLNIVNESIINGHKMVIFSSFKRILNNVKEMFDKNGITSYMITGETKGKERVELVDAFNSNDTNCFLITLKAGGTGLNLIGADTVIHLDIWWNPQVENQATDRTHRIGQTKNVTVIKLITKGTIEEHILELQNKKKFISEKLIENNDDISVISNLTEKDVKDLLSYNDK